MKKFQIILLLGTSIILLSSFRKNDDRMLLCYNVTDISIANSSIVEGNAGQRTVEVMVLLSQPATGPVTITYSTRNGSATAGSDYISANSTLNFSLGENMKKIRVQVIGDVVCEGNETFEIVLSNPSGGSFADSIGTVTIVNDDCIANKLSVYEVRFTFKGYTTFYVGPPECPVRSNGKVVLTGLLSGLENVAADDDITYTGTLQLDIDMDICSVKREPNSSEDKFCVMTAIGAGPVNTELQIYYDQRGGYIKIEDNTKEFIRVVFGDCNKKEMLEEQDMVPNKTIASIFNGYELPVLTNRTFRVGRYVITGDMGETIIEVLRKIQ
jgi:hypothetical protein